MGPRALEALNARRNGLKLKEIGELFGVSKQRARVLISSGIRIEQQLLSGAPEYELSVRTCNAIIRNGCEPTPDAVVECYKTVGELQRVVGLGKKGIAELQAWLVRHARAART
jgi:hypothetical protein